MASQIRTRTGQDARAAIVAAALRLFRRHGVEGTSLATIAGAIGVTKAAVYHHFKTKDEIILEALAPLLAEMDRLVDASETGTVPGRDFVGAVVELAVRHRELLLLHRPGEVDSLGERASASIDGSAARLAGALARVGPAATPLRAALFLAGLGAVSAAAEDGLSPTDAAELRSAGSALLL